MEAEDVEERVINETSVVVEEKCKSRGYFGTVLKGAYFRSSYVRRMVNKLQETLYYVEDEFFGKKMICHAKQSTKALRTVLLAGRGLEVSK